MSRGTKTYAVRLPAPLVERVEAQIDSRNSWSRDMPWTLSDFIRVCLQRELKKMARSRAPRRRRVLPAASPADPPAAGQVEG